MSTKYSLLFQIDVLHSYFSDGMSPTLQIQPTPISQQIMKNYDLRMVTSPSGVKIYQGFEDQGTGSANSKIDMPIVLSFFLKNGDPLFLNYTQLDFAGRDSKIFFANTLPSEADGVIPISPANIVSFTSFQPIIHFSPPAEYTSLTVSLYTIAGEKILEGVLNPEDAATGTFQLVIPNGIADEGELLLNLETEDGQVQEQSLYVLSDQALLETLGVLQVVVFSSIAQSLLYGQDLIYQLGFSPRETLWRYHFVPNTSDAFDQYKLFKNGEVLTEVSGPTARPLPNGQEAQVMTLQSPMALQERPSDKIELEASGGSRGQFTIPLPSADAKRITPGQDENGQQVFYSDMYIYL
jgi:hypothetical protein